jgi:RNA polymerase sigma-70 factor (ECF subfamily)
VARLNSLFDLSDEQLMGRVAARDEAALAVLYDRFSPSVLGLAYKLLSDRATAEEVLQETFWRVWQKAGQYQAERGSVQSWLFAIAHNACIDELRRRKVEHTLIDEQQVERNSPGAPDLDAQVASGIERRQVLAALEDLPPEQREVIEMAFLGGLTRQEIAAKVGVPLGTVHTRARLGLQKLKLALSARGIKHEGN